MSEIFKKKLRLIDRNIEELKLDKLNIKQSLELLKTTTNLLNSANDLILSQNNVINNDTNNFLLGNTIEQYYNELLKRKKIISDLNKKYNKIIEDNKFLFNNDINNDNEAESLLKKDRPQVKLEFVINKKEKLVDEGQKDLEEIKNNMGEIRENINNQKNELNELEDIVDDNEENTNQAGGIINSILKDKMKSKIVLYIINFLLFLLIIIVLIYKFFK